MIKFYRHDDVDKAKWDLCIAQSVNSRIYAYSWYLDIASPKWDALIIDDYSAVFPLTHRTKFIQYLYQPFFTQQLGLFSPDHNALIQTDECIDYISKKYRYSDIQLNEQNSVLDTQVKVKKRKNYLLNLNSSLVTIQKGFTAHTARNIKKSEKKDLTVKPLDSQQAVEFYITHKADVTSRVERADYDRLKKLLKAADKHQMLLCLGAFDKLDQLHASAIVYITPKRLYLINNCVSPEGKESRAMYFLINALIAQFAEQPLVLDFEGSDREGIASFNKGFGAEKHTYPRVKINRLPWPLKWLKR